MINQLAKQNGKAFRVWVDLFGQAMATKLDVSNGHIDFDYFDLAVGFQTNAVYDTDPLGIPFQIDHNFALGSVIRPHLHWIQKEDNVPNWMIEYRIYDNGITIPSTYTKAKWTENVFTYNNGGNFMNIVKFPEIDASSIIGVSAFCDIRLFRDTANDSGLFSGNDPYSQRALCKYLDCHIPIDSGGSRLEYVK